MSEKFIFSQDAPKRYGTGTTRTLNSRITQPNQPNHLSEGAVEQWGGAGTPPYSTHRNSVCVVCCLTQHTSHRCVAVGGGGRYV